LGKNLLKHYIISSQNRLTQEQLEIERYRTEIQNTRDLSRVNTALREIARLNDEFDGGSAKSTLDNAQIQATESEMQQKLVADISRNRSATDLATGKIDISGIYRELTATETAQGLISIPVNQDKIAIVVSNSNDLLTGLTFDQVTKIFTGEITNWSKVGSKNLVIRPILRPSNSGTHQSFQEIGLQGKKFGAGRSFNVLERDATTPLLQALGDDVIGYATCRSIALSIDGTTPKDANYPYKRTLVYV
jgi:phosphate transport system substrate-binding protein